MAAPIKSGEQKAPRQDADGFHLVSDGPTEWVDVSAKHGLKEVLLHLSPEGIAKLTINRPEVHNAFGPRTVKDLRDALVVAQDDVSIGVIIVCGQGPNAFCS
eukprot:CAMPEP_0206238936 /NCGR_PEP_ID=MMETSP0047_2-20121206/15094_1 /ASSEMBLY_ACC=CAM_ASM_000192 /TAXON_ID=195065 /ORGANISM="Chroomonas mesostigmatica_cf, Strain CCMP1168" /LENGTH=101 /DNA_ID=CAMNT_0053663531 /DNA_START=60 /DNA_END=361 /DNA_ORIENTATION=+